MIFQYIYIYIKYIICLLCFSVIVNSLSVLRDRFLFLLLVAFLKYVFHSFTILDNLVFTGLFIRNVFTIFR